MATPFPGMAGISCRQVLLIYHVTVIRLQQYSVILPPVEGEEGLPKAHAGQENPKQINKMRFRCL
jgi:hypothetical protein